MNGDIITGDAMTTTEIIVLSADADALTAALRKDLPANTRIHACTDNTQLPAIAASASVVLAAPDRLLQALPALPALQWAQSTWAGVTPLINAPRQDYRLTGVKGLFDAAISEYVLAWMLALQRKVLQRAGATQWDPIPDGSLAGKKVGVMGTGALGMAVARRAEAFGVELAGLNTRGEAEAPFARCYRSEDRLAFARHLDFVIALMPDTPATRGLIDSDFLHALPRGAVLINAGRANAVDHKALRLSREAGHLRAAVLDVLPVEPLPEDDPLWRTEGIYITSHTAAPTEITAIAPLFLDNLRRFLAGEALRYEINFTRGY
ncbi:MAG: D-2-hydroxyacid dehydrogenase [Chromatocurvus sp.]